MAMAAIDIQAMQSLVDCMNKAASECRGRKTDLAGILGGVSLDTSRPQPLETAASWVDGQVPGLRRRLSMAQTIAAATPNFKAGTPVKIDESKLSNLSPAEAQAKGSTAADKILKGDKVDPELAKELQENCNDPYYTAALAKKLSPEDIANYLQRVGQVPYGGTTETPEQFKARQDNWKLTVTGLSQSIGTATRNTEPDLKLPSDYATKFADAITKHPAIGQAAVLGMVLRNGTFGTSFLDTVSTKVYDYERGGMDGVRWRDRVPEASTPWLYDENYRRLTADPMAGVLSALGNNPEAAQHFFSQGRTETVKINGHEVQVNSRMKYLIQDRTWNGSYSDEGDGLGQALRAASVTYRNRSATGQTSAEIASQALALIGSKTGEGNDTWYHIGDPGWQMSKNMRDEIADIVADYAPDLYRNYGQSGTDELGGDWFKKENGQDLPDAPYGIVFNAKDLQKVVKVVGEDPGNMDKITAGVMLHNRVMSAYQLSRMTPEQKAQYLRTANVDNLPGGPLGPRVLGDLLNDGFGGLSDKDARQKAQIDAVNKWLSIATTLPALKIPGEGAKLVYANWGIDKLKAEAVAKVKAGGSTAGSQYGSRDGDVKQGLAEDTMNMMLQNGFFDDQPGGPFDILNKDPGSKGYKSPPAEALVKDDKGNVVGFNYKSEAYKNWLNGAGGPGRPDWYGKGAGQQITENIKTYYNNTFPNFR